MQESAKSVDARMAQLMDQVQALRDEQRFYERACLRAGARVPSVQTSLGRTWDASRAQALCATFPVTYRLKHRMKQAEIDRMHGELNIAKQAQVGLQQELDSMRQRYSDLEKKVPVQGVLSRQQQSAEKGTQRHRQSKLVPDDVPLVSFDDNSAVFANNGAATTNGSSLGDEGSPVRHFVSIRSRLLRLHQPVVSLCCVLCALPILGSVYEYIAPSSICNLLMCCFVNAAHAAAGGGARCSKSPHCCP